MIKFKANAGGRELVGFILTEKNVEQLKKGHPIDIKAEEFNIPFDILIAYGKDEQTIARDLRKAGMIDPERTVIHDASEKKTRQ